MSKHFINCCSKICRTLLLDCCCMKTTILVRGRGPVWPCVNICIKCTFHFNIFFVSLASFTDQILTVLSIAQFGPAGHGKNCTTAPSRCPGRAFWVSGGTKAVRSGRDLCSPRHRQRTGRCSEYLKPEKQVKTLLM